MRTGFDVRVLFPAADAMLLPDALEVVDGLDSALFGAAAPAFIVVATQGRRDEPGLEATLRSEVLAGEHDLGCKRLLARFDSP